jgi:beta-glucanase (GH16 family)
VSGYDFAWSDDFSGDSLDLSKWTPSNTNVPTNNSQQDYLPEQVSVADGNLIITAENRPSRGLPYRSGLVTSTSIQKHGRWEVRARLPESTGMWPAIWLLSDERWPSGGEIDILENRGNEPYQVNAAFHYGTNPPFSHSFDDTTHGSFSNGVQTNFHDSFHTYAVEWDEKQIRYYVDDVHHWTVRDSDVNGFLTNGVDSMRLIINTAVGGNYLANPDQTTVWPQAFEIDQVNVYTKSNTERLLGFENGSFEDGDGSLAHWRVFGTRGNNISTGELFAADGSDSLKLYGQFNGRTNYSGIEQGISVTAGDELTASLESLIASNDSISGTGNHAVLKIDYYSEQYGAFGSAEHISSDELIFANGQTSNDQWIASVLQSVTPEGAVEARLALVFAQLEDQGGAVFVDDINFAVTSQSVPEPTGSLVLFGIGAITLLRRKVMK